ncbi:hypothetical protein IAQ61_002190 [Plenodomus lingam]|nr:hypothetical protein IAQ61_002190 [Plenodomus lingam]
MANKPSEAVSVGAGDASPPAVAASSTSKMRKRTKTGCLTCRKRRIKCGEERPTCGNCIKSRRQCEGYNQRVVFKPPIGDWPNHPGVVSTIQYHTSSLPGSGNQQHRAPEQPVPPQENLHISIGSHSSIEFDFPTVDHTPGVQHGGYGHNPAYQQPLQSPLYQQPLHSPRHPLPMSATTSYFAQPTPVHPSAPPHFTHDTSGSYQETLTYDPSATYPPGSVAYDNNTESRPTFAQNLAHPSLYQQQYSSATQQDIGGLYRSQSNESPQNVQYARYTESQSVLQRYDGNPLAPIHSLHADSADMSQAGSYNLSSAVSHADFSHASYSSVQLPTHDLTPDTKYMPQPVLEQPVAVSQIRKSQPELLLSGFGGADYASPTQILDEAAIENADDDYWDVQSDDEMLDMNISDEDALLASSEFSIIRRIHNENFNELGIRRYDAFLYDGLLSHYKPEYAASPLRNPKTARVFAHYIHVTGPTLSIYERNPRNPTLIFEGAAPPAQQGLWTYILPLKALAHQGLLHAMLALASLHIARLQGASVTPSYKHYAYSIKRLVRSLGNAKKRLSVSTLATSMLLAYYEVWMAEHVKWSTHLVGAQRLITELDFRSLTREARRLKAAQTAEERQYPYQHPEMRINQRQLDARLNERAMMPDERVVSTIVGKVVSYDEFGMIFEEHGARQETRSDLPGRLDLRSFETLQDLYWSYARHDVYQSIVSGNPLINPYRKWSDCPPRAPIGRADALYGSHDHVILLLGRIADFTVRDRERKLRQVDRDGGWRPRPDMPGFGEMGPPPSAGQGQKGQQPTPTKPMASSPQNDPPPGWTGPPPPGFGPPQGGPSGPPPSGGQTQRAPSGPPPGMPNFYGMAPAQPPAPLPPSYENPNYKRSPPTSHAPHPKFSDLPAAYEQAMKEWNAISAAHTTVAQLLASTDSFAPLPAESYPPVPGDNSSGNLTPFGPALIHRSYDISILWTLLHLAKIVLLRSHPAMPPAAQMAAGVCAPATQPYAMLIGRITAGMQIPLGEDLTPFLGAVLTESTMSLFFAGVQFQDPIHREWLVTRLLEIDRRTGWASSGIIARGCETAWEKAASMGRGPPYKRRTRRPGEEGPLVLEEIATVANWRSKEKDDYGKGARVDEEVQDLEGQSPGGVKGSSGGDNRFVVKSRVSPWALNLLGTEEELRAGMERFGL